MYGTDWISRSSTIAKCCAHWVTALVSRCPWHTSAPRSASRRVIVWKIFLPLFVNCISTTGWFVCVSMSARVPDSFSSRPVISGIGLLAAETVPARHVAADDHCVRRNAQDLPVLRNVLAETARRLGLLDDLALQQHGLRRCRSCPHDVLGVEEVPLRHSLVRQRLGFRCDQEVVQRPLSNRNLREPAHRGAGEVG